MYLYGTSIANIVAYAYYYTGSRNLPNGVWYIDTTYYEVRNIYSQDLTYARGRVDFQKWIK
ncbi:hypothetical protein ACRALDRAFT_1069776 [Sodiomyces alcalophilus JCM 7366]|uniref:uncharacterized protein n=1 Tax=Sodiomyces alcalophilus JCM 7366 TaxID=591952 RepID=UPI0039B6BD54